MRVAFVLRSAEVQPSFRDLLRECRPHHASEGRHGTLPNSHPHLPPEHKYMHMHMHMHSPDRRKQTASHPRCRRHIPIPVGTGTVGGDSGHPAQSKFPFQSHPPIAPRRKHFEFNRIRSSGNDAHDVVCVRSCRPHPTSGSLKHKKPDPATAHELIPTGDRLPVPTQCPPSSSAQNHRTRTSRKHIFRPPGCLDN